MTTEKRTFINLDEIIGIQYKCPKCKTSVTVPRTDWGSPPSYCPNNGACRTDAGMPTNLVRKGTKEAEAIDQL